MKITKEITFDMAHILSNYSGKCANLHGHTYRLQVTLESKVNEETCMLLDFNVLKEILNEEVMERFDHSVIPNGKTTCEVMAPYIRDCIADSLLKRNIKAEVSVKLWETPTSFSVDV